MPSPKYFCLVFPWSGMLRAALSAVCCVWLTGCMAARPGDVLPSPEAGRLELPDGTAISDGYFASLAGNFSYILIGENHDNALHHQVQARLVAALAGAGYKPALGLEMVDASRQGVLDSFNAGALEVDALPAALDWPDTWGFDFALYRPVFEAARAWGVPVYGLNVPRGVVAAVRANRLEKLDSKEKQWTPAAIIPPPEEQAERLRQVFAVHAGMRSGAAGRAPSSPPFRQAPPSQAQLSPGKAPSAPARKKPLSGKPQKMNFERFMLIQSLWDSAMAQRATEIRQKSGQPVVILAGNGHVEYGFGIAHRLKLLDPDARILLVSPFSGRPASGLQGADVFYFAPAQPRLGVVLRPDSGGVLVEKTLEEGRARAAGVKENDLITAAGGRPVHSLADMHAAALRSAGKAFLELEVKRGAERLRIRVPGVGTSFR